MKILVSGANGYVGKYLCEKLYSQGHYVYGLTRKVTDLQDKFVNWIECDISESSDLSWVNSLELDAFIHLAWQELDNYQSINHCRHYIEQHFTFLKKIINSGVKHIQVIGTCFEYGMGDGEISEEHPQNPITEYGKAKNLLRLKLEEFNNTNEFTLQWVRLFYLYGEGQRQSSFVPLLLGAIEAKQKLFPMSGGEQIRDYLHVAIATSHLVKLLESREAGIFNCSSNCPIKMKDFALSIIQESNSSLQLKLGVFPYLEFEPMCFWGSNEKLLNVIGDHPNC